VAGIVWNPQCVRTIPNAQYYTAPLGERRLGVMLHYDASGNDAGAVAWFADPRCQVSYNWLALDDGSYVEIAPRDAGAWHAGICKSSDPARLPYRSANRAFYAISAATDDRVDVTPIQLLTIAWLTRRCYSWESWPLEDTWRIVGHSTEAVYPAGHPKAGQRGRKSDPEGGSPANPIYSPDDVRQLIGRVIL